MTFATGDLKRTKSSGPRTEPRGTPVSIVVEGDEDESIFTKDDVTLRYVMSCYVTELGGMFFRNRIHSLPYKGFNL